MQLISIVLIVGYDIFLIIIRTLMNKILYEAFNFDIHGIDTHKDSSRNCIKPSFIQGQCIIQEHK
jgi:hypothetical protein